MYGSEQNKRERRISSSVTRSGVWRWLHRFAQSLRGCSENDEKPTTICDRVLRAAHREAECLEAATHVLSSGKPRVEAMLALIGYCYAKGILDSSEIEQRLWQDEGFLATFGVEIPSAQSVRAFRRRHRQNILAIIEEALQESRLHVSTAGSSANSLATKPAAESSARRKAEQLLDMANIMDQLAAD